MKISYKIRAAHRESKQLPSPAVIFTLLSSLLYIILAVIGCEYGGLIEVDEKGIDLAVDDYGNCCVLGIFSGGTDFDPGPGVEWRESNGLEDLFLSKFDSNGNFEWVHTWEGYKKSIHSPKVLLDVDNNIYVCGAFAPNYNTPHTVFLNKFDPNGKLLWAHTWKGTDFALGISVHWLGLNEAGHILMAGKASENICLDPGPESHEFFAMKDNCYLAEFDTDGSFLGANVCQIGKAYEILIDHGGNIYAITENPVSHHNLIKYDASGNEIWEYNWDASIYRGGGVSIQADGQGNLYLAGSLDRLYEEDPGTGKAEWVYTDLDIFLNKFDAEGNLLWSHTLGGVRTIILFASL